MPNFSGVPARDIRLSAVDPEVLDLSGKRVAIVGGTGGLGRALARFMAERGADVTVVGRRFRDDGTPRIRFVEADLESMAEAKRIAGVLAVEQLDMLVLTTGIMAARQREQTGEGLERDLAVSYLSRLVIVGEVGARLGVEGVDVAHAAGHPEEDDGIGGAVFLFRGGEEEFGVEEAEEGGAAGAKAGAEPLAAGHSAITVAAGAGGHGRLSSLYQLTRCEDYALVKVR